MVREQLAQGQMSGQAPPQMLRVREGPEQGPELACCWKQQRRLLHELLQLERRNGPGDC